MYQNQNLFFKILIIKRRMRKFQLLFILLLFSSGALLAQTHVLTGTVKDSVGNAPLSDVTVKVKGKNTATITAADGTFSLAVPATSTVLEVSYVGYATRSFTVTED